MSHHTIKQIDELKELLLQEKAGLDDHFKSWAGDHSDSLGESTGELSTADNHPADVATEIFDKSRDEAIDGNLEHQLSEVNNALSRMENGDYGVCRECGQDIPFERLQAIPSTEYCVEHVPEQTISDYRPVEEQIMESGRGATDRNNLTEQNRLDDNDAWKSVEQYGSSDSKASADDPNNSAKAVRMRSVKIEK
jgi:YteA family regulatory protein